MLNVNFESNCMKKCKQFKNHGISQKSIHVISVLMHNALTLSLQFAVLLVVFVYEELQKWLEAADRVIVECLPWIRGATVGPL